MNKKNYDMNYIKENCKIIKLQLNKNHDQDIISYLDSVSNKNSYLKNLIRKEMKKTWRE